MDFENSNLTSVFPHALGDANTASSILMSNMNDKVNGKLLRISPHSFLYMSHNSVDPDDDDAEGACCHIVTSTDSHHYIGGLDVSNDVLPTSLALASEVLNDIGSTDDEGSSTDLEPQEPEAIIEPVTPDVSAEIPEVPEEPESQEEPEAAEMPEPSLEPEAESVNTIPTSCDTPVGCDTPIQTVRVAIPHNDSDMVQSSALIEQAMKNKYGGTIVRHSPNSFTHVRNNGTIDRVNTDGTSHNISSHMIG